jgi:hypothetical protein
MNSKDQQLLGSRAADVDDAPKLATSLALPVIDGMEASAVLDEVARQDDHYAGELLAFDRMDGGGSEDAGYVCFYQPFRGSRGAQE